MNHPEYGNQSGLSRLRHGLGSLLQKSVFWLLLLASASFALGLYGFRTYDQPEDHTIWTDVYHTLQLFFVEMNLPESANGVVHPALQIGRFGALATAVWTILIALFPQVRAFISRVIRGRSQSCALVLGYGPIGQAIAAGLDKKHHGIGYVTAVHSSITPELTARAKQDGVFLIEGDPSDSQVLRLVHTRQAKRIYISAHDDLIAIDRTVAVCEHLGSTPSDVRVVLKDGAIGGQIAEAAGLGFLGATGVRWYSAVDETARLLQSEARFDRVAVEAKAERVHLVIVGAGQQGEAIAVETLLTNWRSGLLPPRITFLDLDPNQIETRMKQRMPAWFDKDNGAALPEGARPVLDFRDCDADLMDFGSDPSLQDLTSGVTAWVFSTGADALNLRAGTIVHRAISTLRIDPAPLYIRIPTGHAEEPDDLVAHSLSLAHTFGSVDRVMGLSPLLEDDPDRLPKQLHAAYGQATIDMGLDSAQEPWEDLSETKREANRALFRTIATKIEDFGVETDGPLRGIPASHPRLANQLKRIDKLLDYTKMTDGPATVAWSLPDAQLSEGDLNMAERLRDAAVTEHNRWIVERALAQFRPTAAPDPSLRDDLRRYHDNMFDWYDLDSGNVRRFDVVLLRALLGNASEGKEQGIRRARTRSLLLPVGQDGKVDPPIVFSKGAPKTVDVTELRVYLSTVTDPKRPDQLIEPVLHHLRDHLDPRRQILPSRLCFVFLRPPGERTLALANGVSEQLKRQFGSRLAIEALWHWRAERETTIGIIGHRDLSGLGDIDALTNRVQQSVMAAVIEDRATRLVCGYAEGADQLAVSVWNDMALPFPDLVFPHETRDEEGAPVFLTDHPDSAEPKNRFTAAALKGIGHPRPPATGRGHEHQAQSVIDRCDIMIALADTTRPALPGGTVDTLRRAEKAGRTVRIIGPTP